MPRPRRIHCLTPEHTIRDAIAEYWTLANDPAVDLTPDERVFLGETAHNLAAEVVERMASDARSYGSTWPTPTTKETRS